MTNTDDAAVVSTPTQPSDQGLGAASTPADPAAANPGDALAELEKLLSETRAAKEAAGTAPTTPTPEPPIDPEVLRQQEEAEALNTQQIAEQQARMAEISDTPQHQARLHAQAEAAAAQEQVSRDNDGFEIHQVTTTKIDT